MDLILLVLAAVLLFTGMLGSFLPVLPGVPLSWVGLLLFYLTSVVPMNYLFLGVTLLVTIVVVVLQYAIPALGSKYFGGSKKGMIGATLGLVVGIFIPIPFGIIIGAFAGAFIGEIINKSDSRTATKAAFGSFIGLLASTFMEFVVAGIFFFLFCIRLWEYRDGFF
ncbi:DUF456 domain-containing protein [Salinimicrobium sp. GXAS 041]|uniref:DUF456 domain-containing protein n=1 Tax=Salinimicrobium sp. GXAS 041 TaxID=3400806 RepID=UPI003C7555BA